MYNCPIAIGFTVKFYACYLTFFFRYVVVFSLLFQAAETSQALMRELQEAKGLAYEHTAQISSLEEQLRLGSLTLESQVRCSP